MRVASFVFFERRGGGEDERGSERKREEGEGKGEEREERNVRNDRNERNEKGTEEEARGQWRGGKKECTPADFGSEGQECDGSGSGMGMEDGELVGHVSSIRYVQESRPPKLEEARPFSMEYVQA